jgi:glycosyltransferase involved in cell wall biosynthesis
MRQLGIPVSAPVVGIVARLDKVKNHEMFLQVAAEVRERVRAAHFVIVGDGPRRHALQSYASELGLDDCSHFVGARADVPDLLNVMDVFALTSHIEANPVSILEAFSSGLPVVATGVGSVPDTVTNGANGYLVEPGDTKTMATRIVHLIRSPQQARKMGLVGRKNVVELWSLEQMVLKYEDLIRDLYYQKTSTVKGD